MNSSVANLFTEYPATAFFKLINSYGLLFMSKYFIRKFTQYKWRKRRGSEHPGHQIQWCYSGPNFHLQAVQVGIFSCLPI